MGAELRLRPALAFLLFLTLCLRVRPAFIYASEDLQITNAERRIDLTSHIVKALLTLKVENSGSSPTSEFLLAFLPSQIDKLSVLKAAVAVPKEKKKSYTLLDVKPKLPDGPNGAKMFSVSLANPLAAGGTMMLEVQCVFTHSLEPFPAEISQNDSQLVYYRDSAYIFSPYQIKKQTTFLRMPSSKVESYTKVEPHKHAGPELTYGPYDNHPPYTYSLVVVHFENNSPFAVVEELVREVQIPHWGRIQVTEHYKLGHAGAKHKGGFSR